MEIWLIRHTTPDIDKGICYGQLDLDVNANFMIEAQQIKNHLDDVVFDRVYSSPLKRCKLLAEALSNNQEIILDARLKEINFGDWEGQNWQNIDRGLLDNWGHNFIDHKPHKGESFSELMHRANTFYLDITRKKKHNKIALVTHSGIIRAFLIQFLEIPALKIFNLELSYGAIIKIKIHSKEFQQVKFIKA